jgi:hypothetical protein
LVLPVLPPVLGAVLGVVVLGEVVLLPEPLDVPLLLGEVVLLPVPALPPVLLASAAECSSFESLPSLFLSSLLKSFSRAVSLASDIEMEPSLSLSRLLNDAVPDAPALALAEPEAPVLEDEVLGVVELPVLEDEVLGVDDASVEGLSADVELPVDELPDEPLLIEPLDWLVLGEAALPLEVDLSVLLCACTDAAKAAAMAAAIRVLLFIRNSPQGKCCSTGKPCHA